MTRKEYDFKSAKFFVHEHYIVAEPKECIDISFKELELLHEIVEENINGPFGLIEHRQKNTSINPVIYTRAKELMPNFIAYALVSENQTIDRSFFLEKAFMKGIQGALFTSLDPAKEWMQTTLQKS